MSRFAESPRQCEPWNGPAANAPNESAGLIGTNLIVRYLVQDHEGHAKAAGKLFTACDRGEIALVVLPSVFAECVVVLQALAE